MFDWFQNTFGGSKPQRELPPETVREFAPTKLPPRRSERPVSGWQQERWSEPISMESYRTEFRRLAHDLYDKFAVEDTAYDELLDSMCAVENEMNRNGGANWNHSNCYEELDIVRKHLAADSQFTPQQLANIELAHSEIAKCGRELEEKGESSRNVEDPIDYLIARIVDWCRRHPPNSTEGA